MCFWRCFWIDKSFFSPLPWILRRKANPPWQHSKQWENLIKPLESLLSHLLLYGNPNDNSNVTAFILNSLKVNSAFISPSGRSSWPLFKGAKNDFFFSRILSSHSFLFIYFVLLSLICIISQVRVTFYTWL